MRAGMRMSAAGEEIPRATAVAPGLRNLVVLVPTGRHCLNYGSQQ